MERGWLNNRGSRAWLSRTWLFRISSLGDPRAQTALITHMDFAGIVQKSQNSRKIRNTPNINNTKVLLLNYTHGAIQPLQSSKVIRKNILQLLKKRKYLRELGKKNSDRAHECNSPIWTASPWRSEKYDPSKHHKLFTQRHSVNNQKDLNPQVSFSLDNSPNSRWIFRITKADKEILVSYDSNRVDFTSAIAFGMKCAVGPISRVMELKTVHSVLRRYDETTASYVIRM